MSWPHSPSADTHVQWVLSNWLDTGWGKSCSKTAWIQLWREHVNIRIIVDIPWPTKYLYFQLILIATLRAMCNYHPHFIGGKLKHIWKVNKRRVELFWLQEYVI